MASISESEPVEDSVAKINDEFAVGSDLKFQLQWERFERIVWIVLLVFIALSLAGVFGRGPVAHARVRAADGSMDIKYERVQRSGTPSLLTINFPQSSIQNGLLQLWVSDSLLKPLGTQRVIPQPLRSVLRESGIFYTFSAVTAPVSIEFQMQPKALGSSEIELQVLEKAAVKIHIFVMP